MTTDPFALTDATPVTAAPPVAAPLRAHVHPKVHYQEPFEAELIGRVGKGKVQVRRAGAKVVIFAVDRFRLYDVDKARNQPRRRLTDAEIDALPWKGAGPDPLTRPTGAASPPWRVLP